MKIPAAGIVGEVALREARATELGAVVALVERALRDQPMFNGGIAAFYPDRVVTVRDGRKWAYPYTVAEDNTVSIGQPAEVVEQHVPVSGAMREAFGEGRFFEAAEGGRWRIRVIRAGLSFNNTFYPDAVLREAVAKFNGARVFNKADAEHIKGDGKAFDKLIGGLTDAVFIEGASPDTGEIHATLNLIEPDGSVGMKLREAHDRGLSGLFGFSVDMSGKVGMRLVEGKRVRVAKSVTKVSSVDLIVEPGAGGELIRMVEALDPKPEDDTEDTMRQRMIEAIQKVRPSYDGEGVNDDQLEADYREAVVGKQTGDAAAAATRAIEDATAKALKTARMIEARAQATADINASKLPAKAKEKLTARFVEAADFTAEDVAKAIADEREYLGSFVESGKVNLAGMGDIEVVDRSEMIGKMLDGFFDGTGDVASFKECYIEITGDKRVTGLVRDCDLSRMAESLGVMREAISSTTFADALGDSVARRMQAEYNNRTDLQAWRRVATVTSVGDFRTQERAQIGGYGNLPAVNQGADYQPLTSPGDEKATYAVSKRGGLETLTLEMIKNDDVGAVRRIPAKLARAAANTLYEFVFDFFRTNPTIWDGNALYHASHNNLFTAALSAAQFAAHRLAMTKQVELGSGKRLGIQPKTLLVPFDLQETAFDLFVRSTNNDRTFVQQINPDVIAVPYWTDANDFVTVADPMDLPVLEIGFLDGKQEPELFIQDSPSVGSMFTADKLTYKIRHIYSGAVLVDGEKGTTKAVVA